MRLFNLVKSIISEPDLASSGLRDIKGPASIALPINDFLIFIAIVAVVALIAFIIYKIIKKRGLKKSFVPEIVFTPEEVAYKKLSDPYLKSLLESGDFKHYYSLISDAVREYISARCGVDAMDSTTWELLEVLQKKRSFQNEVTLIEPFLQKCDLVKFAKQRPSLLDAENIFSDAKSIIDGFGDLFRKRAQAEQQKKEDKK
jgi:hypothetical protein